MNTKWNIDPAHSRASFTVRHMMISGVSGEFDKINGMIDFDPQNPTNARVDIQIEAASINTRDKQRDTHLKSPDFLDIEKYPYLSFKSKRVEMLGENQGRLVGEMVNITIQLELVRQEATENAAEAVAG